MNHGSAISRRHLLGAALAAGALSACSSRTGTSRPRGGPIVLTFWSSLRGSDAAVKKFNDTHRNIQVIGTDTPSGVAGTNAKIYNAAQAGNAPDVITLEQSDTCQFAFDGILTDITKYIDGATRSQLSPQGMGWTTFNDVIYALPVDIEPTVMFYNESIFRKHGVDVPTTWDEFHDAAVALAKSKDHISITNFPTNGGVFLAATCWQSGAKWFQTDPSVWRVDMAGGASERVARYWQGMVDEGLTPPMAGDSQQYRAAMVKGTLATQLNGCWGGGSLSGTVPDAKGQWRVAPLPTWKSGEPSTGANGGSTFSVPVGSAHVEAAVEFIKWMVTSPDALAARVSTGTSTQYPAKASLAPIAEKNFDTAFYGNQNIFRVFGEASRSILPGWIWGPRWPSTNTSVVDQTVKVGRSETVLQGLQTAEIETVHNLQSLGLGVKEGGKQ